jgi:hypothetical protein
MQRLGLVFFTGFLFLFNFSASAQFAFLYESTMVESAESFAEAEKLVLQFEQKSCAVRLYPALAAKAFGENKRVKGIDYLNRSLLYGYSIQSFERSYPDAFETLSRLSADSLTNHIKQSKMLLFDWQEHLRLNTIFNSHYLIIAKQDCDSSARELAAGLRNLLNRYMRINGLPNDCKVGYGMQLQSMRLIFETSHLLFESEWEQLDEILDNARKNYQLTIDSYATLVDNYLGKKFGTSTYGTNVFVLKMENNTYVLDNLKTINQNRKELGLPELTGLDKF